MSCPAGCFCLLRPLQYPEITREGNLRIPNIRLPSVIKVHSIPNLHVGALCVAKNACGLDRRASEDYHLNIIKLFKRGLGKYSVLAVHQINHSSGRKPSGES